MSKHFAYALIVSVALILLASQAKADRRVALVVGNSNYSHAQSLPNPVLDARAMRATLEKLGFEVVYGESLDRKQFGQVIAQFSSLSRDAEVALAFYAGHGATFGDVPYLVPVDAQFNSLEAMPFELIALESLLGELRKAKGLRLALIDACRDNQAEKDLKQKTLVRGGFVTRGLGRVQSAEGLIIAFATQYGMTAADGPALTNSPFTAAALKLLPTPNVDVKSLFLDIGSTVVKSTNGLQRPAIEISLYDSYMLVNNKAPLVEGPSIVSASEADFIDFISSINDKVILENLSKHRNDAIKKAAAKQIELLEKKPTPDSSSSIDSATEAIITLPKGKEKNGGLSLSKPGLVGHPAVKNSDRRKSVAQPPKVQKYSERMPLPVPQKPKIGFRSNKCYVFNGERYCD